MSSREARAQIAEETVRIARQGSYRAAGAEHKIAPGAPVVLTEREIEQMKPLEHGARPQIEVLDSCVVQCIRGLAGKKMAVLNFASAKHPGGGFLKGALAQEEMLCLCSDLYESQSSEAARAGFYDFHARMKGEFYSDRCILSRNSVIRDSAFRLAAPVAATFLTCAAVNQTIVQDKGRGERAMRARVHTVMTALAQQHFDVLVLGAFGCGVFNNSPEVVADAFMHEIEAGNVEAERVVFCIKGEGANLRAFRARCK